MRGVSRFFGLIVATSAWGCALGFAPKRPNPQAHALPAAPASQSASEPLEVEEKTRVDTRTLALAAIDCIVRPAVYHAVPKPEHEPTQAYGAENASCVTAAKGAGIESLSLYRLDSGATFVMRQAIEVAPAGSRSAHQGVDFAVLFEKSVAAVSEGRRGQAALMRNPVSLDAGAIDSMRAHEMVVALDDFGRKTGGELGAYAQTIAMLVSANNFVLVARVPAEKRPFAAEPLLTMMFGAEFLSTGSDEPAASWADYIGAAERTAYPGVSDKRESSAARAAVGGGPVDPPLEPLPDRSSETEASLAKVAKFTADELRTLSQKLPVGDPIALCAKRTLETYAGLAVPHD